jgi:hypothetical protein
VQVASTIQSDVTGTARIFMSAPFTQATSFTLGSLNHFQATGITIGAGSTISVQNGFIASAALMTSGVTTTYGFRSLLASASGAWNTYNDGTAANYFAGQTTVGSTSLTLGNGSVAQQFGVVASAATSVGEVIRGAASQTANLTEWQDSSGAILARVANDGTILSNSNISGTFFSASSATGGLAIQGTYAIRFNGANTANFGSGTPTAGVAQVQITNATTTAVGLIVKGAASQTADLQQWQDSSGTPLISISSDGYINKTGTTYIGPLLTFANPGVGNDTRFTFTKVNDAAWLSVKERAADQTYYEFGMSDNAQDGGDYFQWINDSWWNPGTGWMPLQMSAMNTRFVANQTNFYGALTIPANTPFFTCLGSPSTSTDYQVNKYQPQTSNAFNLNKDNATGGTGTLNVDVSGYNLTTMLTFWVLIGASGTTFSWGNGQSTNTAVATGVAITGAFQTLSNGVQVKLSTTGQVSADKWSFIVFPPSKFSVGGATTSDSASIIYPSAGIKGLVIKGAASQTADLQQFQDSNATVLAAVTAGGILLQQQPAVTTVNATATLTIAQLLTEIITATSTTAVTMTLPTGTLMDGGFASISTNQSFDWSIINLGSSAGAVTLSAGTSHTIVGSATVAISTSAQFRSVRTAATTWVSYRIS